jgi:hypothetical protein
MTTQPATAFRTGIASVFTSVFTSVLTFVCCLWLAGCAGPGLFGGGPDAPPFNNPTLSMQSASDSITVGKSSKADVTAALGAATVINFDSGYEVWVYRAKSREPAEGKAEFVILFSPDGVVRKTRLRPAYVLRN